MSPGNHPSEDATVSNTLPLLDNGKDRSSSKITQRKKSSWPLKALIVVSLLLIGGVIGLYFQGPAIRAVFDWTKLEPGAGARQPIALPVERIPSPERVAAMATGDVVSLGRLQPAGGIVSVALPQGAGDARIDRILVDDGDVVAKGDVLAVLDSLALYESALTSAESTLAIRRAALSQVKVQVEAAEAELRAQIRGAEASLASSERELARVTSLLGTGVSTQATLEEAERAADTARADLDRLRASMTRYESGPDDQQVDIAVATADLAAAEAAVEQARRDLDRGRVLAPQDGAIIEVSARAGERPPADGLLRMGDTARMEAELEVFQTMVPRVAVGQSVSLVSGVLGDEQLTGTVSRIGTLVGRQSVTADDPAANTDARVLLVTVALDEASSLRAASYVNLEVVARIAVASDTPEEGGGQ
ncbi:HlyD family efflux transporter periplasmic adaptor subunit [Agrobacterium sp. RAC06]|uniref:HlyD family efflux transporter periplasmic adaptor subunit n=1 Tax=Agrobacterium sp. RAC06 TaxID=1842536 RepID=UPI00083D0263|nr:HlyD family efflux transporter periplasmic adaptor subunit [Agrobacterium sp. RAC06]AOG12826.1 ABC exporter membrane fusion, DevB family protein [Agrobacterium sp. RAC06]